MSLIWATRGKAWGFRFLLDGGYDDPLPVYGDVFAGIETEREVWRRVGSLGALRFLDPDGRKDRAGRVIPHDFVVPGKLADQIHSVADGLALIWPSVAVRFAEVWDDAGSISRGFELRLE